MKTEIVRHREGHREEVAQFNDRMRAAGIDVGISEDPESSWLPELESDQLYEEHFLALNESGRVCGGYTLKHQLFQLNGEIESIGFYHAPLSEGLIDKSYAAVGTKLLMDAIRRRGKLYCLGMGSVEEPLPRMLGALRWTVTPAPFLFYIVHPSKFLRNIQALRNSPLRRLAIDIAALSGVGWAGCRVRNSRYWIQRRKDHVDCKEIKSFDSWCCELWNNSRQSYPFAAVRDTQTLQSLYPPDNQRFLKLRVTARDGATLGWAVCLDTQMVNNKHFGDMRLGSIVDLFAAPADAFRIAAAATDFLANRGVDLIVTNQSMKCWTEAFNRSGYLNGPSNFIFAASKKLAHSMDGVIDSQEYFVTRGDGDGPIHL